MTDQKAIRKPSDGTPLAERAYDVVREAIESGKLAPGNRISEYRVAEWLGISRTPAREGLRRLEAEGLLSGHDGSGLVVVSVDEDAQRELFLTREVLESALAAQAALNGSGPDLAAITRHARAEAELFGDCDRMYVHNKIFHDLIRRAAHNRYLAKMSATTMDMVTADRRGSTLLVPERQTEVIAEHAILAEAIAARNAAAAAEAAAQHVRNAYTARLRMDLPEPGKPGRFGTGRRATAG
ncbi:GntR family transcriptional regulator [Silicimonas algicola]|uniref:GntR family transcriptional regulator n=1 Tax=Silicimonas algicola TaxID=1826607 RepID=A0A316G147_9RHOB|nr:GntR family transcriptional regulator [Silicimonas algicola]AZQ68294.1 GntR family transcriptional regulator [Silicimonas algicola]PWK54569.1 GntR family transcriptional regulator [Silicimonas algicola]